MKAVVRRAAPQFYRRILTRHEDMSMRIWERLCAPLGTSDGILDIGAFRGDYALAARRVNAAAPIWAFEPSRQSCEELRRLCGGQRIEVVGAAVGERDDTMKFQESERSDAQNQLSSGATNGLQYDVDVVSLDTWTTRSGARPQIMKIDVEGWEPAVIRGARRTLETYRPVLVCEVLSRTAGQGVMSALPAFYRYFQIDELGTVQRFPVVERRQRRNRNWLLVPDDRIADVLQRIQG